MLEARRRPRPTSIKCGTARYPAWGYVVAFTHPACPKLFFVTSVTLERRGEWDQTNRRWLHSRRHERRPAAMRGIVLYPMNALVNDQLSRLRRILARGDSPDWQRRQLAGNVIHFGMYTSLAPPTGLPGEPRRRERWEQFDLSRRGSVDVRQGRVGFALRVGF